MFSDFYFIKTVHETEIPFLSLDPRGIYTEPFPVPCVLFYVSFAILSLQ